MSDAIQLLPDSVANQIAAGEVIQRPASVIKELVENAVDAGATEINVLVVDAGRTSIQVIDNGCGMSDTDARLCFERHATSKIRKADDLFSLHTMGFRGEALPSIAAVAQVELKTRRHNEDIGTQLQIAASRVEMQQPVACSAGSNFLVKNLFYNVPARRKFLKSNTTELNHILTAFERIILVYPHIRFTFHNNGIELYNLHRSTIHQRIVDVFGKKMNGSLLNVEADTTLCKIYGYVGTTNSARKKGVQQYFFVNGRYMRHPYFHKAVMKAFERLIPAGEQIPYFIYFDVPAEDIDVNIHPTKTEIKFENEQAIWQILAGTVRDAVGRFHEVPQIEFDTEGQPDIPVYDSSRKDAPLPPNVNINQSYNPFGSKAKRQTIADGEWEKLYNQLTSTSQKPSQQYIFDAPEQPASTSAGLSNNGDIFPSTASVSGLLDEKSPNHYQYKGQYIVTAVKSGLMLIDQHRAHTRILYEEYLEQINNQRANVQKMLFPEIIEFSGSDATIMEAIYPQLQLMGFDFSPLGGGSYAVNGIPNGIEGIDIHNLLHDMVSYAAEHEGNTHDDLLKPLAAKLARYSAIPYGQILSSEEMDNLVSRLFACTNVNLTPDGQNILAVIQQNEIEKLF